MAGGQIHEVFSKRLADLRTQSAECAQFMLAGQPRAWMVPTDWETGPFNIAAIHTPSFDRTQINENYIQVHAGADSGGAVGDAAAIRLQLDYVAILERGFRSRHASRVRCLAHGAARLAGHGHSGGAYGFAQNHVAGMLKAAGG